MVAADKMERSIYRQRHAKPDKRATTAAVFVYHDDEISHLQRTILRSQRTCRRICVQRVRTEVVPGSIRILVYTADWYTWCFYFL